MSSRGWKRLFCLVFAVRMGMRKKRMSMGVAMRSSAFLEICAGGCDLLLLGDEVALRTSRVLRGAVGGDERTVNSYTPSLGSKK